MNRFVIGEHKAKRAGLHYDFRLEKDKKLKSWSCRKIIPRKAGIKRLCNQVEDHALSWLKFSGPISEGYGKGQVKIWDHGKYEVKSWSSNKITFSLKGNKIKGEYVLIRMGKKTNWLLFKKKVRNK